MAEVLGLSPAEWIAVGKAAVGVLAVLGLAAIAVAAATTL